MNCNLSDKNDLVNKINDLKDELAAFTKSREDIIELKEVRLEQVSAFFRFGTVTNVFTLVFSSRLDSFVFAQFCLGILYIFPKVCINVSYKGYMFSIDNRMKSIIHEIAVLEDNLSKLEKINENNKIYDDILINKKKFSFNHKSYNDYNNYIEFTNTTTKKRSKRFKK